MAQPQLRPGAFVGAARISGGGSLVFSTGLIISINRTGTGVYEIGLDPSVDPNEHVFRVQPILGFLTTVSASVNIEALPPLLQFTVNGFAADCDCYIEIFRVRTEDGTASPVFAAFPTSPPPPGAGNTTAILDFQPSRFYQSQMPLGDTTTENFADDILRAVPIYIPNNTILDRIGFENMSTGAGFMRLGIYNDANGVPGSLVLDAGTISLGASGFKDIAISQAVLGRSWFWLASVHSVSTELFRTMKNTDGASYLGFPTGDQADADPKLFVSRAFPFDVLPDPFGAFTYEDGEQPRIMVRSS